MTAPLPFVDDEGTFWRVVITDTEGPTGVAPICPHQGDVTKHSTGDGCMTEVDESGVYDCCPHPHLECHGTGIAKEVAAFLNARSVRICE